MAGNDRSRKEQSYGPTEASIHKSPPTQKHIAAKALITDGRPSTLQLDRVFRPGNECV